MARITVYLSDDIEQAFRQACEETELSYSTAVRELIVREMRHGEMFDTIPDEILELAEKEARQEEIMAKQKLREKRASFDDRIQGFFRKRLQGDAAYEPQDMEELADGYRADAQNWFDDPDRIAEKVDKVDHWMRVYRAGYRARQHAERSDTQTERSGSWFQIGEDLESLESRQAELLTEISEKIKSDGFDPDAIIRSLAKELSVEERAVEIILDKISPETTRREALVTGDEVQQAVARQLAQLQTGDGPTELSEGEA